MNASISRGAIKWSQAGFPDEGSSFPETGRDAAGRGNGGEGTAPLVEILNHLNSVTTALCKCIQSFITVTAVIATCFRGAVGL